MPGNMTLGGLIHRITANVRAMVSMMNVTGVHVVSRRSASTTSTRSGMTDMWRPSNGTEGEIFAHNRCHKCVNDRFDYETFTGDSCPIWMNALSGVDDSHLYWDADAGGERIMTNPNARINTRWLGVHHPECFMSQPRLDYLCICDRIFRVSEQALGPYREDQEDTWWGKGYDAGRIDGYRAAKRDAVEAVKAVYRPQEGTYIGLCIHADAVAAIETLGGEQ